MGLDLRGDPIALTAALVDIPSESRDEQRIADEVEAALREQTTGFEIVRNGNAVLARTNLGTPSRVILAGHLDTVPIADNVPSRRVDGELHGCGTSDMKSGDAVFLHLAATVDDPAHDITLVMYDCEEIEAAANGLGRIERELPDWLHADVAILGEPSGGFIEAGCQGTLRVVVTASGTRAHSARSWLGDNAIHKLGAVLDRLTAYEAAQRRHRRLHRTARGCRRCASTAASRATSSPTRRRSPSTSASRPTAASSRPTSTCARCSTASMCTSSRPTPPPGALPGLTKPAAAALVEAAGGQVRAKFGWTDVARFAALGVPAVNFGPGDPNLAHRVDERVEVAQITAATDMLRRYLTA